MKELLSAGSYPYSARPRSNLGSVRTHTKAQRFEAPCDSRPAVVELAKAPPSMESSPQRIKRRSNNNHRNDQHRHCVRSPQLGLLEQGIPDSHFARCLSLYRFSFLLVLAGLSLDG